jgi:hypothetical protein
LLFLNPLVLVLLKCEMPVSPGACLWSVPTSRESLVEILTLLGPPARTDSSFENLKSGKF